MQKDDADRSEHKTRSQRFWEWYTREYMGKYFSLKDNVIGFFLMIIIIGILALIGW